MHVGVRKRAPGVACSRCSRSEVRRGHNGIDAGFHYAPCGLPCEGGPIPDEERREHNGTHSERCRACKTG